MKRLLALLLVLTMSLFAFVGCAKETPAKETPAEEPKVEEPVAEEPKDEELAEGAVKTGLAVVHLYKNQKMQLLMQKD